MRLQAFVFGVFGSATALPPAATHASRGRGLLCNPYDGWRGSAVGLRSARHAMPAGLAHAVDARRPWFLAVLVASVVSACGTTPATDFRGRWQAVNQMELVPRELPLHAPYVYAPSPLDRTLKGMLTRWARDSGMTLSYEHGSDFTLHRPVSFISDKSLQSALTAVGAAYAAQGVLVEADATRITVRSVPHGSAVSH